MKAYEKYKQTSDDWLLEIPANWEFNRCCSYGRFATSSIDKKSNPDESEINLVNFTDVFNSTSKWITDEIEFMRVTAPKKQIESNDLMAGDVLFTPSSEVISEIGLSAVVKEDLIDTCYSYHLLRYRLNSLGLKSLNKSYLRYLFNNEFFLSQLSSKATGTTRKILSLNSFRESRVIIPPLPEQRQIAAYLDYKTNQIDRFITNRKKQIELLEEQKEAIINKAVTKGIDSSVKLKPSGVDWIGDIPEHWEVWRIGHTSYVKARIGWKGLRSDEFLSDGYAYLITGTDFKNGGVDFQNAYHIHQERYDEDPFIQVFNGDLLITKDGTIGKVAVIENLDKPACLNSGVFVVRPLSNKYISRFLYYIIESIVFKEFVQFTSFGTTINHLYQNVFVTFKFPLPKISEQEKIIEFIVKELAERNELISKYQKQIDLMQEYKTSLISKAVTGKIDIREWQPKQTIKETV